MEYVKLKPHKMDEATREAELRQIWKVVYCDTTKPIYTFDNILVKFYEDMFKHTFFESSERKAKNKDILSLNRLEKMLWIKDTLQDEDAILKQGWDRDKKKYLPNRRVAFVKGNYIVIISINKQRTQARFVTAYEMQENENKVIDSPDWV